MFHHKMPNPIGARELLQALPSLLARTDWPLSQPADAAAALVHTIHIALGFRSVRPAAPVPSTSAPQESGQQQQQGDGDDDDDGDGARRGQGEGPEQGQGQEQDFDDSQTEATYVNPDTVDDDDDDSGAGSSRQGRLADDWNAHGEGSYVLEYKHEQSSMEFRIRVGRMGGLVQVDAMAAVCFYFLFFFTVGRSDGMAGCAGLGGMLGGDAGRSNLIRGGLSNQLTGSRKDSRTTLRRPSQTWSIWMPFRSPGRARNKGVTKLLGGASSRSLRKSDLNACSSSLAGGRELNLSGSKHLQTSMPWRLWSRFCLV